jgi:DNA polymerase (family 10)
MTRLTNRDIAVALDELADLIQLNGERAEQYRVRALRRGAKEIERLAESAVELHAARRLEKLPGIGEGIARRVAELAATGQLAELEVARRGAEGLLAVARLDGMGPTSTRQLRDHLGVRNLDDLEAAAAGGRLAAIPALARRAGEILAAIDRARRLRPKVPADWARREAAPLLEAVRAVPGVVFADFCGSLRRRRDAVGDIDIMAATEDPTAVAEAFTGHRLVEVVLARGVRSGIRTYSGLQVDVFCVGTQAVGLALHHWTGSKEHLIHLRTLGLRQGLKMNEDGIWEHGGAGARHIEGDEYEPYRWMKMQPIPPELRENRGEIERALAWTLPQLLSAAELRGDVHVHARAGDGRAGLDEIVAAAAARGLEYVVVVEHSPARGGLDEAGLAAHARAVAAANQRHGGAPRLIAGVEVDILADGTLDLPARALAGCDFVLAAAHSHLDLARDAQTRRMVAAINSGLVDAVAHPSGRRVGLREPVDLDLEEVVAAAAAADVALEINCHPERHDLGDVHAFMAREARAWLVMGSDAHDAGAVGDWGSGLDVARRAWVEAKDVLNSRPLADFLDLVRARRRREVG